jgi:hypothetical protein
MIADRADDGTRGPMADPERRRDPDPLDTLAGETPPLQRDPLERQSFSLANAPIVCPRPRCAVAPPRRSGRRHGGQQDADALMLIATKNLSLQDRRPPTSGSVRCTHYQLLVAIGRATGDDEYQLLKGALTQLTLIRITRYGLHCRRHQFSWIDERPEPARSGRCNEIEFLVPAWFDWVLDRLLVSRAGKHRSGTAHRQERDP